MSSVLPAGHGVTNLQSIQHFSNLYDKTGRTFATLHFTRNLLQRIGQNEEQCAQAIIGLIEHKKRDGLAFSGVDTAIQEYWRIIAKQRSVMGKSLLAEVTKLDAYIQKSNQARKALLKENQQVQKSFSNLQSQIAKQKEGSNKEWAKLDQLFEKGPAKLQKNLKSYQIKCSKAFGKVENSARVMNHLERENHKHAVKLGKIYHQSLVYAGDRLRVHHRTCRQNLSELKKFLSDHEKLAAPDSTPTEGEILWKLVSYPKCHHAGLPCSSQQVLRKVNVSQKFEKEEKAEFQESVFLKPPSYGQKPSGLVSEKTPEKESKSSEEKKDSPEMNGKPGKKHRKKERKDKKQQSQVLTRTPNVTLVDAGDAVNDPSLFPSNELGDDDWADFDVTNADQAAAKNDFGNPFGASNGTVTSSKPPKTDDDDLFGDDNNDFFSSSNIVDAPSSLGSPTPFVPTKGTTEEEHSSRMGTQEKPGSKEEDDFFAPNTEYPFASPADEKKEEHEPSKTQHDTFREDTVMENRKPIVDGQTDITPPGSMVGGSTLGPLFPPVNPSHDDIFMDTGGDNFFSNPVTPMQTQIPSTTTTAAPANPDDIAYESGGDEDTPVVTNTNVVDIPAMNGDDMDISDDDDFDDKFVPEFPDFEAELAGRTAAMDAMDGIGDIDTSSKGPNLDVSTTNPDTSIDIDENYDPFPANDKTDDNLFATGPDLFNEPTQSSQHSTAPDIFAPSGPSQTGQGDDLFGDSNKADDLFGPPKNDDLFGKPAATDDLFSAPADDLFAQPKGSSNTIVSNDNPTDIFGGASSDPFAAPPKADDIFGASMPNNVGTAVEEVNNPFAAEMGLTTSDELEDTNPFADMFSGNDDGADDLFGDNTADPFG